MTTSPPSAHWFTGSARSGKTHCLVDLAHQWLPHLSPQQHLLLLAANDEGRQVLTDRLGAAGSYPLRAQTPLGFIQGEVLLFYPLLVQVLDLPPQTPIRLRPETEQALATALWQPALVHQPWKAFRINEYRFVRRLLDWMQLAANGAIPLSEIPERLRDSYGDRDQWPLVGELLTQWQHWCYQRGLLTYGLISDLFWRCLWPHPHYQAYFCHRYGALIADDTDDYPALIYPLLERAIDLGPSAFSYNPAGQIRLGLGSDPDYLLSLSQRCQVQTLATARSPLDTASSNSESLIDSVLYTLQDPTYNFTLPPTIQEISRHTRGEMLRAVVTTIATAIQAGTVAPNEIAIILPGLDTIARYTLSDALTQANIPTTALNTQQPLATTPSVRAVLTLLALTIPGLGHLVERDRVAEMLVELSRYRLPGQPVALAIDPVRAGLLADRCYSPHPEQPQLHPITDFQRWDRLGARAAQAYERLRGWLAQLPNMDPVTTIDTIITEFLDRGNLLPADLLAIQRALVETAQHFWQVTERVYPDQAQAVTAAQFIQLLYRGTVTANPYPSAQLARIDRGVTLANIFQYRSSKLHHPWQFWLDVGSDLWARGGAASLYGYRCFLQDWDGSGFDPVAEAQLDRQRLVRVLRDLLQRSDERLYLCTSDLAVNGQEQVGPLLALHSRVLPDSLGVR